ncbi:hypothetical protein BGM19_12895 [Streptomyces agglomeratus]|uniref:hypothetical protein n=1 Tax=Streptomyces agglomeratus TaxID=285458 RepID=UPI000869D7ED|nr:hypothetical protein [Streptomyces agglomeratus]OEJ58758.1 hypothetical protein BGM19_12895 [Streptomyces agglomeratus]
MTSPTTTSVYASLVAAIEEKNGVLQVDVRRLRDILGAGRTGSTVARTIETELARAGILHFPPTIPTSQDRRVVLCTNPMEKMVIENLRAADVEEPTDADITKAQVTLELIAAAFSPGRTAEEA